MGRKTALIIDDEADHGRIIALNLKDRGFDTVLAYSGEDGFNKAKSIKPDLITMDLLMPGEDGIDVIKKMGEDEATKNIPIVVVTVLDNRNLKKELEKNDRIAGYLVKPVKSGDFTAITNKVIRKG
ncbi:MAG: response regulator [Elusimicrobiota bacterium]